MRNYRKTFPNSILLNEEFEGYQFYSLYYRLVPNIRALNISSKYIDYEDISSDKNTTLFSILRSPNSDIDMRIFFLEMAKITRAHGKYSHVIAGGTQKFYLQRIDKIDSDVLTKLYEEFMGRTSNQLKLNSYSFHKNTSALIQIIKFTNNIGMTYVIPSQGDLHDMNIFQNGYVVDFEAAGWNRLSTDVATFLHHIMAGSNYFGPKYAKWAETMNVLPSEQVNNTGNGSAHVVLNTMRKNLIKDYMHYYIDKLDPSIISRLDQEFSYMLAFRLLTVYDVTNMTQEDQDIVFILVNYFISDETLDEKLARFVA